MSMASMSRSMQRALHRVSSAADLATRPLKNGDLARTPLVGVPRGRPSTSPQSRARSMPRGARCEPQIELGCFSTKLSAMRRTAQSQHRPRTNRRCEPNSIGCGESMTGPKCGTPCGTCWSYWLTSHPFPRPRLTRNVGGCVPSLRRLRLSRKRCAEGKARLTGVAGWHVLGSWEGGGGAHPGALTMLGRRYGSMSCL